MKHHVCCSIEEGDQTTVQANGIEFKGSTCLREAMLSFFDYTNCEIHVEFSGPCLSKNINKVLDTPIDIFLVTIQNKTNLLGTDFLVEKVDSGFLLAVAALSLSYTMCLKEFTLNVHVSEKESPLN